MPHGSPRSEVPSGARSVGFSTHEYAMEKWNQQILLRSICIFVVIVEDFQTPMSIRECESPQGNCSSFVRRKYGSRSLSYERFPDSPIRLLGGWNSEFRIPHSSFLIRTGPRCLARRSRRRSRVTTPARQPNSEGSRSRARSCSRSTRSRPAPRGDWSGP